MRLTGIYANVDNSNTLPTSAVPWRTRSFCLNVLIALCFLVSHCLLLTAIWPLGAFLSFIMLALNDKCKRLFLNVRMRNLGCTGYLLLRLFPCRVGAIERSSPHRTGRR